VSSVQFYVTGPLIEEEENVPSVPPGGDLYVDYRGFTIVARARKAPVGWVGELCIFLSPPETPIHGFYPISRFHMDPQTAVHEALLEGILRVERGQVIAF